VDINETLKSVWGYDQFRPMQREVIDHVLAGGSGLVLMPTGQGKSLCFQLPSVLLDGLTVVISPLIALMKDQVDEARSRGLSVALINSSLRRDERVAAYRRLGDGSTKLLYITPERFRKEEFLEALGQRTVSLLAVDEAHCISQWGHDFRPDYSRLKEIRGLMGNPPTVALTATATVPVQKDILHQLDLPETTKVFSSGFARPNLDLQVREVHQLDDKVRSFIFLHQETPGSKIVYFALVDTLRKFSDEISRLNIEHFVYHGQLSNQDRKRQQKGFINSEDGLILATPAFGLGVNKANIRGVIHAELPGSIEAYYQEVGRAGRDGKPASCTLLYDPDDISIQMDFIKWANPEPEFFERVYNLLCRDMDAIHQNGYDHLREKLLFYHKRDFRLETVIRLFDRWGVIENLHNFREWKVSGEIPEHLVQQDVFENQIRVQNQKLLQMVELTRTQGDLKVEIEDYFNLS